MNAEQYSILALRTATSKNPVESILHASMGMAGEAGEVVDLVKKITFYGKQMDRTKLLEEAGDLLWYVNLLISALESSWSEVFEINVRKLEARYPNLEFCADKAINRDVEAEAEAIANVVGVPV